MVRWFFPGETLTFSVPLLQEVKININANIIGKTRNNFMIYPPNMLCKCKSFAFILYTKSFELTPLVFILLIKNKISRTIYAPSILRLSRPSKAPKSKASEHQVLRFYFFHDLRKKLNRKKPVL